MGQNLRDRYCIVGIGETDYSRNSGRTTRVLAVQAVKRALDDAGLGPGDVDGLLSYHAGDSVDSTAVASDLGLRPNFYLDATGGGSSTEALIGIAMGAIEAGMCHTVAIFRALNGYTQVRIGGTGARWVTPVREYDTLRRTYGWMTAAQNFAFTFMRHMMEYGTTSEQVAQVKVVHSKHASNNPKALMKQRVSVEDVLSSRWITKPLHLLDCCLETDNATCIIVTSTERARNLRQRPIYIMGVMGRVTKPAPDMHYQRGPITRAAGYYAAPIVFGQAGITPEDVNVTAAYDAFTFTTLLQLEDYGFCQKGEGGEYVSNGTIELGNRRPNCTSGGQLCEGYTNGMNLVVENVRQLRGLADDYCPHWQEGVHTYDYSEAHCRQMRHVEIAMNMGWYNPATASALILRR